ncbi:MAG: NADH:flavin oxidoreductase [Caulobacterales bacterium]
MKTLFDKVNLGRGFVMRNRFMMGPLTNMQSPDYGHMSEAEFRWLEMRTKGGFGMMSTCAANVRPDGASMAGQIGLWQDSHMPQLRRVATAMKAEGNVALMQINHGGLRAQTDVTGANPVGPYAEPDFGGVAMTTAEVRELIQDFVTAAKRAQACGFDGVEVHGAHAQVLSQFLSPQNTRTDGYGGPSLEERSRAMVEVLRLVREACGSSFLLGLRLSTERYEINLEEFRTLSERIMTAGLVDFLDMSLWDCFKSPEDATYRGRPLVEWALDVKRGDSKVGVSGKIRTAAKAQAAVEAGADFVVLGRAAILHDDFPLQAAANSQFEMKPLPVSVDYLHSKCVSDPFIGYLRMWDGFVADSGRGMYTELGTMVTGDDPSCFATGEFAELQAAADTV